MVDVFRSCRLSAGGLQRLEEQPEVVWDRGCLLPDDLPVPLAAFVELGDPRLVGEPGAGDDEVEVDLEAEGGGVSGQAHGDRGNGLEDEVVDVARLDGIEVVIAREQAATGVDRLEVVGDQPARTAVGA